MPENKEVRKWQNLIKMSIERRKRQFSRLAAHYWRLYTGEDWPVGTTITENQQININRVYGNVQTQMPAVFLRDPKIFVKNKQKTIDTGISDRLTKQPVILDGYNTAQTVQNGVNSLIREINLKDEVAKVRNDALIGQFGVMYIGYKTEFGIDDEENEYVREEDIFNQRMSPFDFLVDVELSEFDLSKARWCGREVRVSIEDIKDNPHYKNKEDIDRIADIGFGELLNPTEEEHRPQPILNFADEEFKKSEEVKRITLYEIWVKPTLKERLNPKNKFHRGKVIVMAKGHKAFLREDPWPLNIDGFPFELLTYNRINDRFYPIADISTYEPQLHEKNELRTAQLSQSKIAGNFKIIVDEEIWDEEKQKKLTSGDNVVIPVKMDGGDIRSKIFSLTPGSVSSEYYLVDQKIDKDIEEITNLTEIFRGTKPRGEQTATQTRIQDIRGSSKFSNRLDMTADFYVRIVRKDIQLMKQFYSIQRMQELTGMDPQDISWSDRWSEEKIKLEFDLEIDISNMVPTNEAVEREQSRRILEDVGAAISNPAVVQKLEAEGFDLSMSEAIKEVFKTHNIKNDKILTRLSPQEKQQRQQQRLTQQAAQQQLKPKQQGTPSIASQEGRAQRVPRPQGIG